MKLLFDQKISYRIILKIADIFPETKQVMKLGLDGSMDREIWEYAKKKDYSIITFNADFSDLYAQSLTAMHSKISQRSL